MKRAIGVIATALLVTGCGGYQPDMQTVEDQLADDIATEIDVKSDKLEIDCPSSIEWETGSNFRCFAEDKQGNKARVTVYMENSDGEYTWELENY